MELRHLRYFVAVCEELNFRRAAARLNISQPPLSEQIRKLEDDLGVPLFTRTNRRVALTDAGRVFFERCKPILDAAEVARTDARRAHQGLLGTLTVGFVGSAAYSVFPSILSNFRAHARDIEIVLRQLEVADQVAALIDHSIDVGVLRPPIHDKRVSSETILCERFVAALPQWHRLAGRRRIALRDLSADDFILFPHQAGIGFHSQVLMLCERAGFVPHVTQLATPMQTVIGLVGSGLGVSVVPHSVRQLAVSGVAYVDLSDRGATTELALAWRSGDTSAVVGAFLRTSLARSLGTAASGNL